ncbi:MAG TPA: hypothetical protein VMY88_00805 [Acidimicrobiales bacterium]|nr:hypothetical protein [Acidimicrobiales bacterium]
MNPTYRRVALGLVLLMVIALLGGFFASVSRAETRTPPCTDAADDVSPMKLTVQGQQASGLVAYPAGTPKGIVAFTHGYGHSALSWSHHLRWAARELGVVAVVMDNRGLKMLPPEKEGSLPKSRGWNVSAGALDIIAATQRLERCAPTGTNVMFSVSMGGNTAGLALAEGAQRANKTGPLYDYWVDVEGATNVLETYLEARVLAPANGTAANALEDITAEMGGPIEAVPEEYTKRSVVTRVDDIAAGGLKGVIKVHGVDDGLVPFNQAREMVAALDANGIPVQMVNVLRRTPESERETTLTGYAGSQLDSTYTSPFAGHASETSTVHVVMKAAWDRLVWLYRDNYLPDCRQETVVDGADPELTFFAGC